MMDFLIKHKLVNPLFSAWVPKSKIMPNKSDLFFEEITKCVEDGSPVDVIYLDFQNALHKLPHQRLILKLKSHGSPYGKQYNLLDRSMAN